MKPITPDDLRPGDILLCSEDNALSRLIMQVDQGGYSHTILYVGVDKGEHMIVHATTKGIAYQPLSHVMDMKEIDLLDAFRFQGENGEVLGSPELPVEPVIENAMSYVGGPYFYSELILGGLVILSVDQFKNPILQMAVKLLGSQVEHGLSKLFEKHTGKKPMVCVQVATTAFYNASNASDRPYGIKVKIDGTRKHVPLWDDNEEINELKVKLLDQYPVYKNLEVHKPIAEGGFVFKAGSLALPLGTCTLRDMSRSPSLTHFGTLKDTRSGDASK